MAITKEKKKLLVEKAEKFLKDSPTVVFVKFSGLKATDTAGMRKEMKKQGVGYSVVKKTLLRRAIEKAGISGNTPELSGEIAVSYLSAEASARALRAGGSAKADGSDQLSPAREIYSFVKRFKDNLSIIGGIFDGKFVDRAQMLSIATIPPREVLLAQFVNLINSPIQRFAVVLSEVAKKKQ